MADRIEYEHECLTCGATWTDENMIGLICSRCCIVGSGGPLSSGGALSLYELGLCSMCSIKDVQIADLTLKLRTAQDETAAVKQQCEQWQHKFCEMVKLRDKQHAMLEMLFTVLSERLGRDWSRSIGRDAERRLQERQKAEPER